MELTIKRRGVHKSIREPYYKVFQILAFISLNHLNQWNQVDEIVK